MLSSLLLKKNLALTLGTNKVDDLKTKLDHVSGRVLQVAFNKQSTKFDITDYIKVSKKHRSNVVDVLVKDIFQYNFTGICIRQRKDPFSLNTSFLVRNVFDQFPYELNVPLYSPLIDYISVLFFRPKLHRIVHSKYYYLRKKPLPMSKVLFFYVVGMYSPDNSEEKDAELFFDKDFIFRDLKKAFF